MVVEGLRAPHAVNACRDLDIGDHVEVRGRHWVVRGRLEFEEVGVRWTEHVLDREARVWLTVEDGDLFEVSLWQGTPLVETGRSAPDADEVEVNGRVYRLPEPGRATYLASGETWTDAAGMCDYVDYRSVDRRLLGFEDYGTGWKTAEGEVISPEEVGISRAPAPAGP